MHFERPAEPEDFEDKVRAAREAVARAVEAGQKPEFDDKWGSYKRFFATAQRRKCAYCEVTTVNHDPAIDHFAPKSAVWELSDVGDERGHEIMEDLPNVRGRTSKSRSERGYWWRAYEWENFLLVCSACNSKWKECYFPVAEADRCWPPDPEVTETPLLLNPFDDEAPWRHFRFGESGVMAADPESTRGEATLVTLGFERRESMRLHREGFATDAYGHARAFVRAWLDENDVRAGFELENMRRLGADTRDHAGMVRAICEHVTGLRWDELVALASSLLSSARRDD
ncbi:hypothetical protein [Haliangium sp.]|uniref:hypothetical protein n=1 Tax=Haliangium sp. TaxID=2663208 RepID=UPI003D0C3340